MADTLIALGSNLGDKAAGINAAIEHLASQPHIELTAVAPMLETAPIGVPDSDAPFINSAARFQVDLTAEAWLAMLLDTEQLLGRTRGVRWGARKIDLDLLLFDDLVANSAPLRVPHPRMGFRRFVMEPAVAIAPDMWHPICRCKLSELAIHLNQQANWVWWPREETSLPLDRMIAPNVPWHFLPRGSSAEQWRRAAEWMLEKPIRGPGARVIVTDDWPAPSDSPERVEALNDLVTPFPKLVVREWEGLDPFESLNLAEASRQPVRLMLPLESRIADEVRRDVEAAIESML
ncbi:MAG: 2-amino-4-hydroxy-6-hydroxymethyldihydropteridine diphosphokinase [Planctomycetales bacterium]|nr:2-amino-4-hydroxy-6-hydroxymethyldihydropteridine diphosphokinase [Planctomycetales bacterium]